MSEKSANNPQEPSSNEPSPNTELHLIAVGASAGGLEAIHEFFDNMTVEGMAVSFFIIQHLSPDYKSLLVELVSKHTSMEVLEATHNTEVETNCIYVIPNNKLMTIQQGRIQLEEKTAVNVPNTAIDIFLHALAEDAGPRAIAVILSGTGTDGSRGIESIKESGGVVFVQDPKTAKFDGMPNSAINSGHSDFILPPSEMPAEIQRYIRTVPDLAADDDASFNQKKLNQIFDVLEKNTGYDFHEYKTPTILRRLAKRMLHLNLNDPESYISFLETHPDECGRLVKEFLIGVTHFFREKEAFDIIQTSLLPQIVAGKNNGDTIKVWVTACSTGEEAYSMAIILDQFLEKSGKSFDLKIFATDIDPKAIEIASRGSYPLSISKDIEPGILQKYFTRQGSAYVISPIIRKHLVFARHNLFKDPPFIKNDLVSCRNMLIYMNNSLQRKVLNTLAFSLNDGGVLFLGTSENISFLKDSFEEINAKLKIYRKLSGQNIFYQTDRKGSDLERLEDSFRHKKRSGKRSEPNLLEDFKEVLSEEYNCAAIYIDKNFELKEATGNFRKYISLPDKTLNLNILKMVSPELSMVIHSGIRKAQKAKKRVRFDHVKLKQTTGVLFLDLIIDPRHGDNDNAYMLIVLKQIPRLVASQSPSPERITEDSTINKQYIEELEADLKETRINLQTAVEGLESANEELQSGNEELLSANEELQSSNEELQSLNEELHTLNTEHQLKINELVELNDDLNNYFRTTEIGQVFLDAGLRIRKFNLAAVKMINLIENDIGRPFAHISTNLRYEHFYADIAEVMENQALVEKEVTLNNNSNILMRIVPYIRQDKRVDGVVITFIDITAIKDLDSIIKGVFNASRSAIMVFRAIRDNENAVLDLECVTANSAADMVMSAGAEKFEGKKLRSSGNTFASEKLIRKFVGVIESGQNLIQEIEMKINGEQRWFDLVSVKMGDGIIVTLTETTDKKESEQRLKKNYNELINTKENLRLLNEELENKVEERTRKLSESEERFRLVSKATNDAIWDWNLVQNEIWWNENFYQITGYPADKPFSRPQWLEKIHPDDRKKVNEAVSNTINNQGHQCNVEYRFLRADGEYADILDRSYLLKDEFGTPYRMLGSMLDVTSLRRAEEEVVQNIEQRKFLAESMPLIVWTANPKGEVDFLNRQFTNYSGIEIHDGYKKGWQQIIHTDDLAKLKTIWIKSRDERQEFSVELRMRRSDRKYRWHLLRARPRLDEENNIILWLGSNTEIHEQKLANEILEKRVIDRTRELHKINEELESSNIELQQFAFVASHDLKEPLRKINMFSLIVKDKYLKDIDEQAAYLVDRIIHSSTRMTRLVNDLLDFSRLSINQLFQQTNLNEVIQELLMDLELVIQEKKAKITIEDLPTIDAVPAQIRQVFQNIISNAIKFSKKDVPPRIHIGFDRTDNMEFDDPASENGNFCRITVTDNGIGFEDQYATKIFTIFQRLHTKETYEGTGIGLAITKKIVEKHNGTISARSDHHEGATFIIILPFKQIHASTGV